MNAEQWLRWAGAFGLTVYAARVDGYWVELDVPHDAVQVTWGALTWFPALGEETVKHPRHTTLIFAVPYETFWEERDAT